MVGDLNDVTTSPPRPRLIKSERDKWRQSWLGNNILVFAPEQALIDEDRVIVHNLFYQMHLQTIKYINDALILNDNRMKYQKLSTLYQPPLSLCESEHRPMASL